MPTEFTIEQYLRGKVRNVTVPDEALLSVLAENEIDVGTAYSGLTQRQRDMALAGLYVWVAMSPTTSNKVTDKDAHWEHSEGGETMSANVLNRFLRMANDIYAKYDIPTVGNNQWGMVGRGIHNIHHGAGYKERNL